MVLCHNETKTIWYGIMDNLQELLDTRGYQLNKFKWLYLRKIIVLFNCVLSLTGIASLTYACFKAFSVEIDAESVLLSPYLYIGFFLIIFGVVKIAMLTREIGIATKMYALPAKPATFLGIDEGHGVFMSAESTKLLIDAPNNPQLKQLSVNQEVMMIYDNGFFLILDK